MATRRLYLGPLTDSRRWDHVQIRPDDVIVVTPPKCGTTWMQTIIALLFSGDPEVETQLSHKMPWVDIRFREITKVAARLDSMAHRRCLKSHTPMDGLPLDGRAQYICVFRHPLDAHLSYRRHLRNVPMHFFEHWYPEDDPERITFRRFLDGGAEGFDGDAMPLAHILRHYQAALALADQPNVTLFHYADMSRDLPGCFAQVAKLLGITHDAALMRQLIQTATFENMQKNADRFVPSAGSPFFKSDAAFFHAGKSGQWRDVLIPEECAAYDSMMDAHLPPEARKWLENGGTV